MGTVTINGNSHAVLGTLAAANLHMDSDPDLADIWAPLSPDQRGRWMVKATRTFDLLQWKGTKTSSSQEHAFPRNSVTDGDGVAVSDGTTPALVEKASYQLAGMFAANPGLMSSGSGQGPIREVSDGVGKVGYYYSQDAAKASKSTKAALPREVLDMIRGFLLRANVSAVTAEAYGTDGESIFDEDADKFLLVEGL